MATQTDYRTSEDRLGSRPVHGASRGVVGEEVTSRSTEADSPPEPDMTGHLGNLGADLITLGELQLELLSVDARDAAQKSFYPGVFAFLGLGFVIGCCPLALLGVSWWLADVTELSVAGAAILVALAGLVLAGIFLFLAWKGLRASFELLNRSRIELSNNLRWIKRILSQKHRNRRWRY